MTFKAPEGFISTQSVTTYSKSSDTFYLFFFSAIYLQFCQIPVIPLLLTPKQATCLGWKCWGEVASFLSVVTMSTGY